MVAIPLAFGSIEKYFFFKHVRSGFPRDKGLNRYPTVATKEDYLSYLMECHSNHIDAHIGFYSYRENLSDTYNRIFMDTDIKGMHIPDISLLESMWSDMQPFLKYFWDYLDVYYTGNRGFHYYLYTEPFHMEKINKNEIKRWLTAWCGGLTYLDVGVILDTKHQGRVPLSFNNWSKKTMIPIKSKDMKINEILTLAENPTIDYLKECQRMQKSWNLVDLKCICEFI